MNVTLCIHYDNYSCTQAKYSWNSFFNLFFSLQAYIVPTSLEKEHCEVSYTLDLPGSSTGLEVRGFKVQKSTPRTLGQVWDPLPLSSQYKCSLTSQLTDQWHTCTNSHYYCPWCNEDGCAVKSLTVTEIFKSVFHYYYICIINSYNYIN